MASRDCTVEAHCLHRSAAECRPITDDVGNLRHVQQRATPATRSFQHWWTGPAHDSSLVIDDQRAQAFRQCVRSAAHRPSDLFHAGNRRGALRWRIGVRYEVDVTADFTAAATVLRRAGLMAALSCSAIRIAIR
jgi:hypothetical protein